jgi:hypothetical protein
VAAPGSDSRRDGQGDKRDHGQTARGQDATMDAATARGRGDGGTQNGRVGHQVFVALKGAPQLVFEIYHFRVSIAS